MFYIKNQKHLCIYIIGPNYQQQINYFTDSLGKCKFNYSTGRIRRSRHSIVFSTISEESNSVNIEITQNWFEKVTVKIMRKIQR